MKKNNKPDKKVTISQSMDDVTKDKIILVDKNGKTLGEFEKKTDKPKSADVTEKSRKMHKQPKQSEGRAKRSAKIKTVTINQDETSRNQKNETEEKPNYLKRRKLSKKERRKRKRRAIISTIAIWVMGLVIIVIAGILFSFFFCKLENVTVEGSTIYSDEEIKNYIIDGDYPDNCVYEVIHNFFKPKKDIAFIERAKVRMSGLNTVRIIITERIPIAYVALEEENVNQTPEQSPSQEATVDNNADGSENNAAISDSSNNSESGVDTDMYDNTDYSYNEIVEMNNVVPVREPASRLIKYFDEDGKITDISDRVLANSTAWQGIVASGDKVGEIVVDDSVKLDSFLTTVRALKANNIFVNTILIDDNHNIFGTKDSVKINFGLKNDMDEKCKRLSIILPKLDNQPGTLHLENFSPENTDIVFKMEK